MNKKDTFYLIFIVAIILYSFNYLGKQNNEIQRQKDNVKALQDSTTYFKNKQGEIVATKLVLQLTKKELKEVKKSNSNLAIALKNFKRPITIIETNQEVRIDTVLVPYRDTIPFIFNRFEKKVDKYYSLNITSNQRGNTISNLTLTPNKQTIIVGDKRNNIFKDAELRVDITNSNKYFNQKNIKPIVIVYKKSWFEKPVMTIPIGIVLGLLID